MNNKTILGISLGAVFAIGMIMTPAYAGVAMILEGTITDGLLKDHSDGERPANNPAHWTIAMTSYGNWTQYAVDAVDGGAAAVGVGIVNGDGYATFVASHIFDDCDVPTDCDGFLEHAHGAQLVTATVPNCGAVPGAAFETVQNDLIDVGVVTVTVAGDESSSEIKVKKIPSDIEVVEYDSVCNVDEVADITDLTAFSVYGGANGYLCIVPDAERTLEDIDGKDGPNQTNNPHAKNPNKPTRDGGFHYDDESFCSPPA